MSFFDKFTPEQMRKGYANNLPGLIKMRDKAKSTGKKVNGYTHQQLIDLVNEYENRAKTFKK